MVLRAAIAMLALASFAQACSWIEITPREALAKADVVFRGTVIEIHDAQRSILSDVLQPPKHIGVFRVNRVWKGDVGETFELPIPGDTGACPNWEKFAVVGNELLVYARRSEATNEYATSLAYRTGPVKNAAKDLSELGEGNPRERRKASPANH